MNKKYCYTIVVLVDRENWEALSDIKEKIIDARFKVDDGMRAANDFGQLVTLFKQVDTDCASVNKGIKLLVDLNVVFKKIEMYLWAP